MFSTEICRWLFLVVSLSTWIIETNSKEMRVVCYYTNWSVYRPGGAKFSPQNINPYLCSHLIYAFGGFTKENTLKPFDKYQDIEKGGYAKFTGLKTYNKNLKTLIAIGGWNEGSSRFSSMVANADRRKEFVKNAIKFLRLNRFDGLDLDWEYPAFRDGGKPRDKDNYAHLVQELREEFERESEKTGRTRLLLTMAVPAGIEYVNKGFDVPKLTKYLDWMNILSYDYHSAFEPAVNHHAPLFSLEEDNEYNYDGDLNIDHTVKHYLKLGAQPNKLVVGIPTYGRSYTLFNPDAFEIGSPADGPGTMGDATRENGYLAYYEICDYIKNQDWEVDQPNPEAMGPIAFKDDQWVGYDDEDIVRKKAEYVAENGLGGIMFWAIDNDDFRGNCHGKPYPLIEAGKEALLAANGITEDNLIVPPSKPLKSRTRTKSKISSRNNQSEEKENVVVEKSANGNKRRTRINSNRDESKEESSNNSKRRRKTRRKNSRESEEPTSYSSLKVVTPAYTTPAPPSTPDLDGAFKCEDEGFFPHPKDCKKYFWCLSGAGDSGIVAHQFTCPAGLYFNKAADSCDYSQNVLCNKKLQKTSKSSTTEAPSTSSTKPTPTTSATTRVPPKITAATSRTTFRQTTTTEAYDEDEYEYEDDDDEDKKNSKEEDPKVIKELIDLIKKAGGLEELEKQLGVSKGSSSSQNNQYTTQTPISKSLFERVLSKTLKNTPASRENPYSSLRNSRGPQNEGLGSTDVNKSSRSEQSRGRLSYTSISRNRSTTSKSSDDDDEDENDDIDERANSRKLVEKTPIEYVNIRRNRVGSATADSADKKVFNRNQILGEDDETEDEDDDTDNYKKNAFIPQYVNIRRPKPSTTEEPETSKYVQIRRGTTESTEASTESTDNHTSKYKTIRRGTTTTQPTEESPSSYISTSPVYASTSDGQISSKKYISLRRGSTTISSIDSEDTVSRIPSQTETPKTIMDEATSEDNQLMGFTTEPGPIMNFDDLHANKTDQSTNITTSIKTHIKENTDSVETEISGTNLDQTQETSSAIPTITSKVPKRPNLFEPRPFSKPTRATPLKPITESTTPKVSQSNLTVRLTTEKDNIRLRENVRNKQYISRGASRYRANNTERQEEDKSDTFPQKRRITTTEKYTEEHRNYRPSELADLSSLTAVDFSKIKELNLGRPSTRRRRPVTTTTTTPEPDEAPTTRKTGPQYFTRRRKLNKENSDQTQSDTELTQATKKIRRFGSRSTEEPSTTETVYSSATSKQLIRNRKIIRRRKPTTSTLSSVPKEYSTEEFPSRRPDLFSLNKESTPLDFQKNKVEEEDDDDDDDEGEENIKLSESNIRENSAINSFVTDPKLRRKLIGSGNLQGKSYLPDKSVDEFPVINTSTEPNIVVRTRKIVRKLSPTEPTITEKNEFESKQSFGRKRKVIRKLRPVSVLNRIEDEKMNEPSTTDKNNVTDESTETNTPEDVSKIPNENPTNESTDGGLVTINTEPSTEEPTITPKRIFRPKLYNQRNENDPKSSEDVARDSEIIRIGSVKTNATKRVAYRGRNKILRPKIIQAENRFKENGKEKQSSSTPRYILYSRRPSAQKTTETDSVSSTENLISSSTTGDDYDIEKNNEELDGDSDIKNPSKSTESPSSENTLFKRPSFSPYFVRSKSTTVDELENENLISSPEEHHTTTTYYKSSENDDELSNSASSESSRLDVTSEYSVMMNATDFEVTNSTETYTEETGPEELITTTEYLRTTASLETSTLIPFETNKTDEIDTSLNSFDTTTADTTEINDITDNNVSTDVSTHNVEYTTSNDFAETTKLELFTTLVDTTTTRSSEESFIEVSSSSAPESTTHYHRTISLRPVGSRPKFIPPKLKGLSTATFTEATVKFKPSKVYGSNRFKSTPTSELSARDDSSKDDKLSTTERSKFNKYKKGYTSGLRTTERIESSDEGSNPKSINKFLYKYSTTQHYNVKSDDKEGSTQYGDDDKGNGQENEEDSTDRPITRLTNHPNFLKTTTEDSRIIDALKNINTEAVKNRNKMLFSKKRVMNIPVSAQSTSNPSTESEATVSTYDDNVDSQFFTTELSTEPSKWTTQYETTEDLTTFRHIFAEPADDIKSTTVGLNEKTESTTNKVERLIEVNRIVKVETQEDHGKNHVVELDTDKVSPVQDKVGEINRVTVIKVVDNDDQARGKGSVPISPVYIHSNASTTESPIKSSVDMIIQIAKVQEIPAIDVLEKVNLTNISVSLNTSNIPVSSYREGRKFEIFGVGGSKIVDNKHFDRVVGKAEIIDGISHINVVTPRSAYNTESSTISLEGLFRTEGATLFNRNSAMNEELLETDNSKFVSVRVLHPDERPRLEKEAKETSKVIPIKILKQDDEDALKAEVVEVPANSNLGTIKIAPIKVQMSRSIASNLPLIRLSGKSLPPA